jgi:DNA modification methylase
MSLEYRIGDVFDRLAEIPAGSIDLIVTSPPFLALRSYLPDDHPDKHKEIGSEATPADFIDTLLELSSEWGRVLAPHGSMCVELGDTFSGASQGGGDLIPGSGSIQSPAKLSAVNGHTNTTKRKGNGWPLAKSLTGIPTLYPWSLAYGRNLLTGQESPAGQWRIRNVIVWARPNPPVGALGDKFRPATSYITVACKSAKRYFDLDAVRMPHRPNGGAGGGGTSSLDGGVRMGSRFSERIENPAGAPPLDWHADEHPEDGDWLWKLSTQPYKGSHYATFPMALPKRLIEAMCPQRVCETCGVPSTRITEPSNEYAQNFRTGEGSMYDSETVEPLARGSARRMTGGNAAQYDTLGWTDCGHDNYRTGIVLDPFAGSGTTLDAAQAVGRHAIGLDLDARNADLARERVGMFLDVTDTPEQTLT